MFKAEVIALILLVLIALWVAFDAKKRGMSTRWGTGVLLMAIIFLPLYFVVRKPLRCPTCGNEKPASLQSCEECERKAEERKVVEPGETREGRIFG